MKSPGRTIFIFGQFYRGQAGEMWQLIAKLVEGEPGRGTVKPIMATVIGPSWKLEV